MGRNMGAVRLLPYSGRYCHTVLLRSRGQHSSKLRLKEKTSYKQTIIQLIVMALSILQTSGLGVLCKLISKKNENQVQLPLVSSGLELSR